MFRSRLSGVKVPHYKNTASVPSVKMPPPAVVTIPVSQHIGAPSKPIVKAGDFVTVGQVIAEASGFVSSHVHSSVSGTVKKIDDILVSNGSVFPAVVIESDGEMTLCDSVKPQTVETYEEFVEAVKNSGVVGLGGAGFPTAVKFSVKDLSLIKTVIINGAECEPYITSDTRTMIDDADLMCDGMKMLEKFLGVKNIVIGIESNKAECIRVLSQKTANDPAVSIKSLPSIYPQGGEKVLIYNITGKMVPEGKLPLDVGVIVINCTTLAAIARFIKTGMPLVEKCVTVDGSAVKKPCNVTVPIGTSISDVFEFCGGFSEEPGKVLLGGPMMGIAVPDLTVPIVKNSNAVIALNKKDSEAPKTTPCIRCGSCLAACPVRLNPVSIGKSYILRDADALNDLKVNLCMECGCCSFACPTRQPLVQHNKLAKAFLKAANAKEEKK